MLIRNRISALSLALLITAAPACSKSDGAPSLPEGASGGGDASLQTTLAEPAPNGETALSVETLADGLANPWSLAFLPDGSMLVTERNGGVKYIKDGVVSEPLDGVPPAYQENQAGYFDILPHPDFATNQTVFLAYAHGNKNTNATRIGKATFDGTSLNDFEVIYEAKPSKKSGLHFGGRLAMASDGKLIVTIGEGAGYKEKAQDLSSSFGAMLRLNQDGSAPEDNPYVGTDGALPEILSKGHRSPQGLAIHPETGVIFETEHGARGGDEINVIEPGANYGWPLATYGIDYSGSKISPFTEYSGTSQPIKYWTPSIAPSGLAIYRGDLFADWQDDLLVGALAGTALHRVKMENGEIVGEERYLTDLGARIRDVRVGPDGAIYVLTNSKNRGEAPKGAILRLTPAAQ